MGNYQTVFFGCLFQRDFSGTVVDRKLRFALLMEISTDDADQSGSVQDE